MLRLCFGVLLISIFPTALISQENGLDILPGTKPLEMTGDIASTLVEGVDQFLLRKLDESVSSRELAWKQHFASDRNSEQQLESYRARLKHVLGIRGKRVDNIQPHIMATPSNSGLIAKGDGYHVYSISWPVFGDVKGHGLLVTPTDREFWANIVAIPDCSLTPEQILGLGDGVEPLSQYARRLAECGCQVLVPLLISRADHGEGISNREWLHRSAFVMGRGLIGYEVQKVLAAVDWFNRDWPDVSVGVIGWGEGGLLSLYAGAVDTRIDAVCVSGYFDSRQNIWQEPIDRNVFGLLEKFGDAELAAMIAHRPLIVEACRGPESSLTGGRGAPARIVTPQLDNVRNEIERAQKLTKLVTDKPHITLIENENGQGEFCSTPSLDAFVGALTKGLKKTSGLGKPPQKNFDVEIDRHRNQLYEIDRHSQALLRESHYVRQANTISKFDFSSLAAYEQAAVPIREFFYEEVIGRFPDKPLPFNARSRVFKETDKWKCYEVVLDVFPDVIAYGLLLVPKDIRDGEKRPVVVCQHGLEGRPQMTISNEGEAGYDSYKSFAARLADRGFVTFAPQNLYIFTDRFRTLQRKANPLQKTLFSIITPQHQQIVDWLQSLDFVDPDRIGFYGLSYGGKTAMRVPALVTDYCLSICSADFNEWVDKNASTRNPRSYVGTGEYEIFEFDLGSTFNYAEMAALIAPRPFMVERGHFDGVADDWTVAYEYAKIRHLYAAKLGIPDRTEIEWFAGPHTINGKGTFEFLHRHLNWPLAENSMTSEAKNR